MTNNHFFPGKSCRLRANVQKYGTIRQATQNIIQRMCIPCWVRQKSLLPPKPQNTSQPNIEARQMRKNQIKVKNFKSYIKKCYERKSVYEKYWIFTVSCAKPTLLYGSETWVTTKRDMTRLEAAEMCCLRRVKGYTRLDKIRSEIIRKF
jgi:hypothetical protein